MQTNDIFESKVTAAQLNESMFKKFGVKVNFNKYTREQLENYRNLIRTEVNQIEGRSNFNDLLSNETYQRNKYVLDVLNTKIKEMLGEGAKVDRQAMHITKSMMKKGKSKDEAESIAWAHIKHPKKDKKNTEGTEMNTSESKKKKGDGNLANNAKPYDKVTRGDVIAGRLGKDAKGGKVKEASGEAGDPERKPAKQKEREVTLPSGAKVKARSVQGWQSQKGDKEADKERKATMKESKVIFRRHVAIVNESLRALLNEDEEGKAKAITAASDMVNDFTTWMQRVGQYQTKAIIELSDEIRAEFGQAEAEAFKQAVAPALATTLETMTAQRETISHAVAVLAGEATDAQPMGMDPGMDPGMEPDVGDDVMPADDDEMNTDGFDAADAASGGASTSREIREHRRAQRIAESHNLMRILSK